VPEFIIALQRMPLDSAPSGEVARVDFQAPMICAVIDLVADAVFVLSRVRFRVRDCRKWEECTMDRVPTIRDGLLVLKAALVTGKKHPRILVLISMGSQMRTDNYPYIFLASCLYSFCSFSFKKKTLHSLRVISSI